MTDPYPIPRSWIFEIAARPKPIDASKRPEFRQHAWSRFAHAEWRGYVCDDCGAWLDDDFLARQTVCVTRELTSLDLLWCLFGPEEQPQAARKCRY